MKNDASFEPVQPEQVKFIVNNNQINNNDSRIRVKQNKVIHVIVYSVVGLLLIGGLILLIFLLTNSSESENVKKTNISSVNSASIFEPVPNVNRIVGPPAPNIEPIPVFNEKSTLAPGTDSNSVSNPVSNSDPNPVSITSKSIVPSSTKNPITTINQIPIFNRIPIPTHNPKPIPTITVNSIQILKQKPTQTTTPCPCAAAKPVSIHVPDAVPKTSPNSVPISNQISFPSYSIINSTVIDPELESRRQFVKDMFLESWNTYKQHAWGNEALRPVSKSSYSETFGDNSGLTIVTSMSTLWAMGLKKEFEQGKSWIAQNLDLSQVDADVRVFDTATHYVGGLLSAYALSGDQLFLRKAFEIGQLLTPAFGTQTGIPYERINLNTRIPMDENPLLSNIGGFKLDFDYLSAVSNNPTFSNLMSKLFKLLHDIENPRKLYYSVLNINGNFGSVYSSLYAESREFYVNLVKSFIYSNRKDIQLIEMYKKALDALGAVKIFQDSANDFGVPESYIAKGFNAKTNLTGEHMEFSGCYLGAMLSMGSNVMKKYLESIKLVDFDQNQIEEDRIKLHWKIAEGIAEVCHQASWRTKTGLAPSAFNMWWHNNMASYKSYNDYKLSPELAESFFILWRLTHNPKYRDYAWKMAQYINKHCRVENSGYSGIVNVNQAPTGFFNYQPPEFMSATLKYLYLTFTEDTEFPLEKWVFNSVGHPLPICGKNPANPSSICKH